MARDIDPKCKKCRRAGEKLFLKGERCDSTKCAMVKRNYPPGAHGQKMRRRPSNYGIQLNEKQKAKRMYGLLEKQFKNYYFKAIKKEGKTGELIFRFLEMRLDNVVYRAALAASRNQARQLVTHGTFKVNGKRVDVPSYQVKVGDEIVVKPSKVKDSGLWEERQKLLKKAEPAAWLELDAKDLKVKVMSEPTETDFEQMIDMSQIVEFYSK